MKNISFFPVLFAGAYFAGACSSNLNPSQTDSSSLINNDYTTSHASFVTAGTAGTNVPLQEIFDSSVKNSDTIDLKQVADTAAANFIAGAALGGMKEIEMGKLAQEKATNPRVKAFGVMMVRDHTKANEELKKIAASKKIPVPSSKESYNAHIFNPKGGKGFEMDYINMMIKDHNETMSLFQRASSNIKDPDLKVFVDKTLHVIHRHLDSARAIYGALMPSDQMDSPVKEKFDDKVTD